VSAYRAGPAADYRIVPLDELTLVYHRPAGATHLLAEPAPELLAALIEGQSDADALLARFALGEGDRAALIERLDELVAAGLVATA
jgi:PqqD family protein of HPr-rel-A system